MRVMPDTNVLLSDILFPRGRLLGLLRKVAKKHQIVLSSYILDEFFGALHRKFPQQKQTAVRFLRRTPYDLVPEPDHIEGGLFEIRDSNDYLVLYAAVVGGVDIFITGDKDFAEVNVERPKILTPAQFLDEF